MMVKITGNGLKKVGGDSRGGFTSGSEFIKKQNIPMNVIFLGINYYMQNINVKFFFF